MMDDLDPDDVVTGEVKSESGISILTIRFECRAGDIHDLPDGSTMFYNAIIVAGPGVGQRRDIFRTSDGGLVLNGAKDS